MSGDRAMGTIAVIDADDRRLPDYRRLNDTAFRRRYEAATQSFVVEGPLAVERLLAAPGWDIRSLFLTPPLARRLSERLGRAEAPVYVAERDVLDAVVGFPLHRGVVAAVTRPPPLAPADVLSPPARVVAVLEGVNDHENLGALFRNAAAFGVDALLLDATTADPLYRRSVRVSVGHVLTVPFARCSATSDISDHGFVTVALTPSSDAEPIDSFAADPPDRIALLIGAEGPGLDPATLAAADRAVRIPMEPGIDSLNVAAAAAIAFHHLAGNRQ